MHIRETRCTASSWIFQQSCARTAAHDLDRHHHHHHHPYLVIRPDQHLDHRVMRSLMRAISIMMRAILIMMRAILITG